MSAQNQGQISETVQTGHDSHYSHLSQAGLIIDDRLKRDERANVINLDSLLNGAGGATSNDYSIAINQNWQPFKLKRSIPLPDTLWEQFDLSNARCSMGFFPEIERVWFTVDHRLILWDYLEGSAFMTYDQLDDVIMAISIAPPKTGYFVEDIKHVLAITTRLKVVLLGIALTQSPIGQQSIGFYLTGLEAPTNGIVMDSTTASSLGRIFMAGADGNLYEVDYQVSANWFRSSSSCTLKNCTGSDWSSSIMPWAKPARVDSIVQIVIDSSRHYLYTRRASGTLELFSLGSNGLQAASPRARLVDPCSAAAVLLPNSPLLDPKSFALVMIHAVPATESRRIGLIGVTSTGARLYFTIRQDGGMSEQYYGPLCLRLAHVRIPPMNQSQQNRAAPNYYGQPQQPAPFQQGIDIPTNHVNMAMHAAGGCFIASHTTNEGTPNEADILAVSAPDIGRITQAANGQQLLPFKEAVGAIHIDGTARAVHEIGPSKASYNELAEQGTAAARAFIVVTTRSLSILARNRPMDLLAALLERGSENNQDIMSFFDSYGRDQTCAMCLSLIAGQSAVSSLAAKQIKQSLPVLVQSEVSGESVTWARRVLYELAGKAVDPSRGFVAAGPGAPGSNPAFSIDGKTIFSGRHEAFALSIARLLKPLWWSNISGRRPAPNAPDRQDSNFPAAYLSAIHRDLNSLQSVLVDSGLQAGNVANDSYNNPSDMDAARIEHESFANLQSLLKQGLEALSFIILLIDHQLPAVLASCPKETQDQLLSLTYRDLLTSQNGRELARRIVSAIINQQISRGQSVDAVSTILQQRCGSFCSSDDVHLHKAADSVRRAKDSPSERHSALREALQLYKQAAKQLSLDKLKSICAEFQDLRFTTGAIDLCAQCSARWDESGIGLAWWTAGRPDNDSRKAAFQAREDCYDLILSMLETSEQQVAQVASRTPAVQAALRDAESDRDNAFASVLEVNDRPLHYRLYNWFIQQHKTDQLLNIRSPMLKEYLLTNRTDILRHDLLWQYDVRNRNFFDAACVLADLAESSEFEMDLAKRLEYLALASSHARSQTAPSDASINAQELIKETDDKLEVAQVQVEVLRDVLGSPDLDEDEKEQLRSQLDNRLYTATELYTGFARPNKFYKTMLLIFYVADYRDANLIMEVWLDLFEKVRSQCPAETQMEAIASTVTGLGKRFYPADLVFPLYDLLNYLEQFALEAANDQTGWAVETLRKAGVPYDALFETFDDLFRTKAAPWHTNSASAFLATGGIRLLDAWFQDALKNRVGLVTSYVPFPAAEVLTAGDRFNAALHGNANRQAWPLLSRKIRDQF